MNEKDYIVASDRRIIYRQLTVNIKQKIILEICQSPHDVFPFL